MQQRESKPDLYDDDQFEENIQSAPRSIKSKAKDLINNPPHIGDSMGNNTFAQSILSAPGMSNSIVFNGEVAASGAPFSDEQFNVESHQLEESCKKDEEYFLMQNSAADKIFESSSGEEENEIYKKNTTNTMDQREEKQILQQNQNSSSYKKSNRSARIIFHDDERMQNHRKKPPTNNRNDESGQKNNKLKKNQNQNVSRRRSQNSAKGNYGSQLPLKQKNSKGLASMNIHQAYENPQTMHLFQNGIQSVADGLANNMLLPHDIALGNQPKLRAPSNNQRKKTVGQPMRRNESKNGLLLPPIPNTVSGAQRVARQRQSPTMQVLDMVKLTKSQSINYQVTRSEQIEGTSDLNKQSNAPKFIPQSRTSSLQQSPYKNGSNSQKIRHQKPIINNNLREKNAKQNQEYWSPQNRNQSESPDKYIERTSGKLHSQGRNIQRKQIVQQSPLSLKAQEYSNDNNQNTQNNDQQENEKIENQKPPIDHQQKNMMRLEAMQAKKAQQQQEMDIEREKTKRRQEKLKNIILKEAEQNRQKKADEAKQKEIEAQNPTINEPEPVKELDADEEEQKKKQQLMRRLYRNRHATFIKTLLDQKKNKEELLNEKAEQEKKKKEKIQEKAFKKMDIQLDEKGNVIRQQRQIQRIEEPEVVVQKPKRLRVQSVHNQILRNQYRPGSVSSRNEDQTTGFGSSTIKRTELNTPLNPHSSTISEIGGPSSKEQKQRKIRAAYNISENEFGKLGMSKRLNRQSSKKSVKSATPVISRYKSGKHQPSQSQAPEIELMPHLKNNNQNAVILASDAIIFDEEKEQQQLQEAKERKERAKKMRERQEKMLNDLKAKKEAKVKAEDDKQKQQEAKFKQAREQVKEHFAQLPEREIQPEIDEFGQKKRPKFTDKNCLQAPDDGDDATPVKKEKKPFIEPDLKAFMERNMPKLQVFANITDMKLWRKKHQVEDGQRVFIVTGGYGWLKKTLRKRGWMENKDHDSPCFDFKWTLKSKDINHNDIKPGQLVNHFPKACAITTKVGLMHNLKNLIWFNNIDIETFYPRCYDLCLTEEQDDFAQEYMAVKAESHLKRWIRELRESANSEEGEIKTSIKPRVVQTAINVNMRRLKDLNEMIDDPKAFELLVSPEEWKILSFDELSEEKLQKQKYEKRLKQLNMAMPPPKSRKRKRKKARQSKQSVTGENEESSSEEDEEDDEQAIDRAITKKFPEFPKILKIIEDLKKMYPQTGINGEQNIWIVKPAQSSRGRGIVLMKSLVEIMEVAKQKEFQFIVQKYIENPMVMKYRKFDLRVWVLVTDWNPLTIWYYKKPYVRLPAHDYDTNDLMNKFSHLANNSIAAHADQKKTVFEIPGNMMSVEEFQEYLVEQHCRDVYEEEIEDKLKTVIINTLSSVQDTFQYKQGCFEIYGFDIMIDEDFNAWLIEVNSSPAMDYSTHITEKLVKMVLEDTCKVLIDYADAPTKKKQNKVETGEYELIYKANQTVDKPLNSYGLNLEIQGKKINKYLYKY